MAGILLWAIFSWPLPMYFTKGIPQSDHNTEKHHFRSMIAGDQLQLMYHFWLASDMIAGKTPLFNNVYEFNRGDDEALKKFDPYYVPYSLVFAIFNSFLSRAAAWNLAGLLSIFVTFMSTYWLLLRMTQSRFSALIAAVLSATFPYRWITLLIGSPTGYGISLIPLTVLGLHIAIKDNKWTGGLLAGIALFFSYCSDLHVFFFSTLTVPFWVLAFAVREENITVSAPKTWLKPALALIPTVMLTGAAAATSIISGASLKGTDMGEGRDWRTIVKYSPRSRGLFSWDNLGVSNHVFLGHIAVLLVLLALVLFIIAAARKKVAPRKGLFFAMVFVASLCVVSLALGANGIGHGSMMRLCRNVIPKYTMIRQAVKTYCLMPLFLSVLIGLGTSQLTTLVSSKRRAHAWISILALLCVIEWRMQISPTICLVAGEEPAYAAVAADAENSGNEPRAVILPLWPGDSHWSSLYEHYASLYHIKMLNGYSPAIGNEYAKSVTEPLYSINMGVISKEQIALLTSMKIEYLIFQEDAFPDQVSPYPASQTLFRLLSHPSLELITQSESIWAFRILQEPVKKTETMRFPEYIVSMRGWELESRGLLADYGEVLAAEGASGGALKLTSEYAEMTTRPIPAAPGQQMNIRIKGHGSFKWQVKSNETILGATEVELDSDSWTWASLGFECEVEHFLPTIAFSAPHGDIYMDMMFLSAGKPIQLAPGEEVTIPASVFYSQGYTDLQDQSVVLRKDKDCDLEILYGMFPLLQKGTYQVELAIECNEEVEPGSLIYLAHNTQPFIVPIEAPGNFVHIYKHPANVPVKIGFKYSRNADLRVRHLKLKRIE